MVRINAGCNAVTEVEDVAATRTKTLQHTSHFGLNTFRAREKHRRIHIALQRNFIADLSTRIANISRPI